MGFQKLLLNIGLILTTITVFCVADDVKTDDKLPNYINPLHYNIRLIPHLEEGNFYGEINVTIEIFRESSNISLHSQELQIYKTATTLTDYKGNIYIPVDHSYDFLSNILTFYFNNVFKFGIYFLHMKFVGNFSEGGLLQNGFMKIPYTDKEENNVLAATFLKPNKARRVFPCWDEPALKATFNISVKHHKKYTVLSNMPMREQVVEQNDMVWTHFNTTPIMSTYLVGIVISNLVRVGNMNETINVWCKSSTLISQADFIISIAKKINSDLVRYTNISNRVPKMDHVIVQDYPVYGMENWGLIIYNESNVIYDNNIHPTFRRKNIAELVTHEVVHQWFGNLVTPSWWSHAWLADGFAVFFEAFFLNEIFEDWKPMDFLVIRRLHDSLAADIGLLGPVTMDLDNTFVHLHDNTFEYDFNTFDNLFINEVYDKAPVLLRMLYLTLSDEVFRKGIHRYLFRNQFKSVTPDDLWSAMQSALDESYIIPHEDFKIKEVMDSWMNQHLYPVLNVTRNYETGEVTITQNCACTTGFDNKWWIPITFATQSNPDFSKTVPNHWIGPNQTSSFEIYSSDWIIVNVQQTAYCRVYYDTTNWQKIVHYLNSEDFTRISVLNRAQIINDAFAFLMENQIDRSVFFNLINYLSREKDILPWHPMFRILTSSSEHFLLPESKGLKSQIVKIFDELLKDIGYEDLPDDDDLTKLLRLHVTKWACTLDDAECKKMAAVKLNKHLTDPDTYRVPQWWQDWTYCFGLTIANRTTWDKMLELYQRKPDKKFLEALNCAENVDIIINYLNIASNTTLFHNEHLFILEIILQKHSRNDLILDYILKNFDNILQNFEIIKPISVAKNLIIRNILWNLFSNEQLHKVEKFAETHFRHNLDTLLAIENMIKTRKNNLLKARDDYIKRFGKSNLIITN